MFEEYIDNIRASVNDWSFGVGFIGTDYYIAKSRRLVTLILGRIRTVRIISRPSNLFCEAFEISIDDERFLLFWKHNSLWLLLETHWGVLV